MRARSRRRNLTAIVAFAVAVLIAARVAPHALAQSSQAPSAPLPTGAISGVVTDAATGRPVESAIVSLGRIDAGQNIPPSASLPRVLTDARGRFVFRNLPASDGYYLSARRFGYAPTRYGWTAPNGSASIGDIRRISVADGQWVNTIALSLWRLGSVGGRVVDEKTEPVVGVAVRVFSQHYIAGQLQWVGGTVATTDDRGVYRIGDLDPGRYVVGVLSVQSTVLATTPETTPHLAIGEIETGAIMAGSGVAQVSGPTMDVDGTHRLALTNFATPPTSDSRTARAYPPAFYPGTPTIAAASPIDIDYGDERTGLDINLEPVPAFRVSGRLDGGPGFAPPPFLLRLMPAGSEALGFGSEVATTIVERDGTFTFLNVPAGQYTLMAQPSVMDFTTGNASRRLPDAPGYTSNRVGVGGLAGVPGLGVLMRNGIPQPIWARVGISVGAENLTNVIVPLQRAIKVSGHIVFAAGVTPSPADFALPITADPASGDPGLGQAVGSVLRDDPGHAFTVEGLLTGHYFLDVAGFGLVSVIADGEDVRDGGIDATPGHDLTDVVVTVTDKFAGLSGVTRDNGSPAQCAVIVFPADRAMRTNYGWSPQRIRSSTAGPNGAFRIGRLPEGDYLVVAVDSGKKDAWVDPKFLEAAAAVATPVSVKWGETKLVNLTLSTVAVK